MSSLNKTIALLFVNLFWVGSQAAAAAPSGPGQDRPREESRVEVRPDGFLRVGGKPFFPIGLYSAGHYEEMATAGFNATHSYAITSGEAEAAINPTDARLKQLLDHSSANAMRKTSCWPWFSWMGVTGCAETWIWAWLPASTA